MFYQPKTIINTNGQAVYYGAIFDEGLAKQYFDDLLKTIEWQNEEIIMFGKLITTARKVAFYADDEIAYTYSQKTKKGLAMPTLLLDIRKKIEEHTETTYNACLLNLYHNGNEGMSWHSDNEKEIAPGSSIASLSLGAERKFSFKQKYTKETVSVLLENGSLLEMKGPIQQNWLHALPKSLKVNSPRINLTFRKILK